MFYSYEKKSIPQNDETHIYGLYRLNSSTLWSQKKYDADQKSI